MCIQRLVHARSFVYRADQDRVEHRPLNFEQHKDRFKYIEQRLNNGVGIPTAVYRLHSAVTIAIPRWPLGTGGGQPVVTPCGNVTIDMADRQ